jgi:hypothetical protein
MGDMTDLEHIGEVIRAAREVQDFLWKDVEESGYNFELWKEILGKRFKKIEDLDLDNHHVVTELRKRLLQTAAVSVAWLAALDKELAPAQHEPGKSATYGD